MIKFSQEFYKIKFTAESMKEAYMKACKWYATNVLSKAELQNVHVEFIKNMDEQFPTVTAHLYAVLDNEEEVFAKHCKCCEEMHHSFFINENNNCNICAVNGYQNRMQQMIAVKKSWYKDLLKRNGGIE